MTAVKNRSANSLEINGSSGISGESYLIDDFDRVADPLGQLLSRLNSRRGGTTRVRAVGRVFRGFRGQPGMGGEARIICQSFTLNSRKNQINSVRGPAVKQRAHLLSV